MGVFACYRGFLAVSVRSKWSPGSRRDAGRALVEEVQAAGLVELGGYQIVMHVHDEIIIETPNGTVDEVCDLMSQTPPWAEGLPLDADGFECSFYRKD